MIHLKTSDWITSQLHIVLSKQTSAIYQTNLDAFYRKGKKDKVQDP